MKMKQSTASLPIVLELTVEQSREIERMAGKFVTELQVEIVEVTEPPVEPLLRRQTTQSKKEEHHKPHGALPSSPETCSPSH